MHSDVVDLAPWEEDILAVAEVLGEVGNRHAINAFQRVVSGFLELRTGFLNGEFDIDENSVVVYEDE